jgi:hypothetical protein
VNVKVAGMPIPVAAQSTAYVLAAWLLVSRDRGFESRSGHGCLSLCLYVVLSCVSRSLSFELITRPKECYHASIKIKKLKMGGQAPAWAVKATDDDESSWYKKLPLL